jgi:hypothetical protein
VAAWFPVGCEELVPLDLLDAGEVLVYAFHARVDFGLHGGVVWRAPGSRVGVGDEQRYVYGRRSPMQTACPISGRRL